MRKITILFFCFITSITYSQNKINDQQKRIDLIDGNEDQFINLKDLDKRNAATYVYFELIDQIQNELSLNETLLGEQKDEILKELVKELSKTDERILKKAKYAEKKYNFLLSWIQNYRKKDIISFMNNHKEESFSIISYIYIFPETEQFLEHLPKNYIDQTLYNFKNIKKADYAQRLIEKTIIKAPVTAKKYFVKGQAVYQAMFMSSEPAISTILKINEKVNRNTKAFVLLEEIQYNDLSIEDADRIGSGSEYFKYLLKIRAKRDPLAEISLDREINYEALEFVREVNHLHESTNPDIRFASVKTLSAAELYTLMVYGEDEIFTSSFNGIYKKFQKELKSENLDGYQLLDKVGFNKFRMFIKMLSYYGELNSFLATMGTPEKEYVLREFISGIPNSEHRIEDAVSIADAISAIEDKNILKIFEEEFYRIINSKSIDEDTRLIYSLLIKMFNPKVQSHYAFFDSISNLYHPVPIERITQSALIGSDGINIQKHFFYDDEDGEASFNSFVYTFRNKPNWKIIEEKEYVKVVSTNRNVKIYANKPKFDESAWYFINEEIEKNNEDVEFIIHRGHSYYVDYTIEQIPKSTKLIMLGSCGGYNKLSALLDKSNNAQIISTKQIGSMGVNNPLIFNMAESIRKGNDLEWKKYWDELKVYFNGKGKTEERFKDYVPPHKNLGAKFIAAYQMYSWVGNAE